MSKLKLVFEHNYIDTKKIKLEEHWNNFSLHHICLKESLYVNVLVVLKYEIVSFT